MSKNNNVNPNHYKTRGREPQGQDVPHEVARQDFERQKAALDYVAPVKAKRSKSAPARKSGGK